MERSDARSDGRGMKQQPIDWHAHLVAHRGESADYPENTLAAMEAALQAGVQFLECDIQLSADQQAMVIHDSRLGRTTSVEEGRVWDYSAQQLAEIDAAYRSRFDGKFAGEPIPRLRDLVEMLLEWPDAHVFVELKRASLAHFGIEEMLDAVLPVVADIDGRYTLISYHDEALAIAREKYAAPIGWVSDNIDVEIIAKARALAPDYVITDAETFSAEHIDGGLNWRWMLFEVNDPERAREWIQRGVSYIETHRVTNFIDDGLR